MRRNAIIAIVAGAVVVVLVWYFAYYGPKRSDVSSTKDKVTEAQRRQQSLQATLARLRELDRNRPQQVADLARLDAAIPPNPALADFILQANDIAAQSGVDWLSISPTPPAAPTTGGGPSVIALNIQVQGGFYQVKDYLNRLEKMPRLVVTDTVNISAGGSSGASGASGASTATTTATTLPTSTSSGTGPTLSVTLGARMFTRATATPSAPGTPGTPGAPGTAPTTPPTSSPSSATTGRPGIS